MKRMVIHCASGIKNSGDEAILSVLISRYSKDYTITVISLNKKYTEAMHSSVVVLGCNEKRKCREAIDLCDIFILGGGGLLQDTTTIYNVSRWLFYLKYAINISKETYVYANSIGPLHYRYNRCICKKTLKKVTRITVRDLESARLLNELQVSCEVTADPVFSIEEPELSSVDIQNDLPKEYITIAIRHWFDTIPFVPVSICSKLRIRSRSNMKRYRKYISSIREAVIYLNEVYKLPIVFLSFCYERDAKVARDILNTSSLKDNNIIINNEFMKPEDYMYIIKKSRLLIGMRLHSIIYAINVKCPFVPILYESKVKSLIETIQMSEWAIDVDDITGKELINKIDGVFYECETIISQNQSHLVNLKMQEVNNYK